MIGEQITFTTSSSIYKDVYLSTILNIRDNMIDISIPHCKGIIVLPGVGTRLSVNVTNLGLSFEGEILERNLIKRYIKISTPGSISRTRGEISSRTARVIAVTSGKGGVGKTSFSINFAVSLSKMGKKVLLFDADLGMANIDVLLGIKPQYDIQDVILGDKSIKDILAEGPAGIQLVPGASGLQELAYLSDSQYGKIVSGFNEIEKEFDYMLIDTGAGLSKNVTNFLLSSDEVFLLTTTEPHAIMDAYSIIKVMTDLNAGKNIKLIINRCESKADAMSVVEKVKTTSLKFLNVNIEYLGHILDDKNVSKSIKSRAPLVILYPESRAAKCIKEIALLHAGNRVPEEGHSGIGGFLNKLRKAFS